jgi:hypothetical protein
MLYNTDHKTGNQLSILGMGCMRFPLDMAETERMILAAIAGGVNLFDTAYIYPNSENTLGKIIDKHNLRDKIYISTKLPFSMCKTYADFDKFFYKQLKRLRIDYIDYYFIHCITDFTEWEMVKQLEIEKWIAEKKATGQIKQIGFSFHGVYPEFVKIVDDYDWQFCMIQHNYYDENFQAGSQGLEYATQKSIPVFIMEPLLGGVLATGLPKKAVEIFRTANKSKTPADWAFSWLWDKPAVTTVLSGMSNTKQLSQNIKSAINHQPLTEADLTLYTDVIAVIRTSYKINCTGCNYCLPCPVGINIPACFSAYNTSFAQSWTKGLTMHYTSIGVMAQVQKSPLKCTKCRICETKCPQHISICENLKKVARRLEPLPFRLCVDFVRKIMIK